MRLLVLILFCTACSNILNLDEIKSNSNSNSSTTITHPLNPTRAQNKISISENEAINLVEQYRSSLENISLGMQYYTYEKNQFFGTPPSTPDLQCEDFIIYKKTVVKIENTKIFIFVQKDPATKIECPGSIIEQNCIEQVDNQFSWPDVTQTQQIDYYQASVNNSPAILIETSYQDPQYNDALVKVEAVSILDRPHLIASFIDVGYFLLDGQQQINIVNNLFFTSEGYSTVAIEDIDISQLPQCTF